MADDRSTREITHPGENAFGQWVVRQTINLGDALGNTSCSPNDRGRHTHPTFEDLVHRHSRREPGLVTRYFNQRRDLDAALIPMSKAIEIVLWLYSLPTLDQLEGEGYFWEIVLPDVTAAFRGRDSKVMEHLETALKLYRGKDQSWGNDHVALESPHEQKPQQGDTPQPPWYVVLGVSANATFKKIQDAYRVKILQYHPDRVAGLGPELQALAERCTKEINHAYQEARRVHGRM